MRNQSQRPDQWPRSAPVAMNQVKTDQLYQPCAPVPGVHTSVHQQTSHNQYFGFYQGAPVKFLPEGTQNPPSMTMTVTQPPQPLSTTFQYYGERLNCTQHYCMPPPPVGFSEGGPVNFLPKGTQNQPFFAVTSTPGPQPPPRPLEHNGMNLDGPQRSGTSGDLTACQLRNPSSSLPQGVAGTSAHCSHKPPEEALQKRELRLMKNREAARAYRRRRTKHADYLEIRNTLLEEENRMLREQLKRLNPNIQISCLDQSTLP